MKSREALRILGLSVSRNLYGFSLKHSLAVDQQSLPRLPNSILSGHHRWLRMGTVQWPPTLMVVFAAYVEKPRSQHHRAQSLAGKNMVEVVAKVCLQCR